MAGPGDNRLKTIEDIRNRQAVLIERWMVLVHRLVVLILAEREIGGVGRV